MSDYRYFSIEELCYSYIASKLAIPNRPNVEAIANMDNLIRNLLDPLRSAWGEPITVSSGYRSPALNKVVGGAKNSQHLSGEAVDLCTSSRKKNKELFEFIRQHFIFDQLINENNYQWIHVSYRKHGINRKQTLTLWKK